jgi:ubiquitin-conjugating enzyme E2 I
VSGRAGSDILDNPATDQASSIKEQAAHTRARTPQPPKVSFNPVIFHPNVYPSGTICLSILNAHQDWKSSISVREVMMGVQELLNTPNLNSPAQSEPYQLLRKSPVAYEKRVREEARKHRPAS